MIASLDSFYLLLISLLILPVATIQNQQISLRYLFICHDDLNAMIFDQLDLIIKLFP